MVSRNSWSCLPSSVILALAAIVLAALLSCAGASGAGATDQTRLGLEQRFAGTVRPFLQSYCVSCHGKQNPKGQLDLAGISAQAGDSAHWALVLEKLVAKQMPPPGAGKQPSAAERDAMVAWIRELRRDEVERNAGDPGTVPARRLSNAEYDNTIRDLTGVDLRPTREFPVDPANQEGFDNSGESLTLSPALMKKYLQAARQIADHLVLKPAGFDFAPHPVLAETDRDKYSILRIIDFYKRQPTDYADYFLAAWRYRNRAALGTPQATLPEVAAQARVSSRYLELVWNTLNAPGEKVGPIAMLQAMWKALPPPDPRKKGDVTAARQGCAAMRDFVVGLRQKLVWKFSNLALPRGFSPGGQAFIMWKNRQYASHRRLLNPDALQVGGVSKPRVVIPSSEFGGAEAPQTVVDPPDPDLFVPKDEAARAPYLAAFQRFCSVFPDAFYISERGRMHLDRPNDKGRLLSAGLHNAMGYFRDDTPLMELILDEKGRQELDRLWLEFDFVAFVPERMHLEFIFYERAESKTISSPEFDFARSEDKDATSDAKIRRLAEAYLAKARASLAQRGGAPVMLQAIEEHFRITSANIRAIEKARAAAEPSHRTALLDFARRAYRRPLTPAEREDLEAFYRSLREKDGLGHEEAVRDVVVSILMSPHFLFRLDLEALPAEDAERRGKGPAGSQPPPTPTGAARDRKEPLIAPAKAGASQPALSLPRPSVSSAGNFPDGIRQVDDYALASRLSYFLWSSMPDEELMTRAAAGELHRPEVLAAQARRMLRDARVRGLALEFGGNWLDFRRFEEHNAVDRERFPSFNDELRQAMFEEPVRFLMDQFQNDRSVLDMLYGKHTFVNASLARHYGMEGVKASENEWVRVESADRYGRGGLLPMAVFLTRNSPGLRTSPVKRGYWVVRRVLGERIPPPPATVPELPQDEGNLGDRTLRQVLAEHRANPACAGCHARFDSFGLVFEGYGPIGEARAKDLGGKPVDTRAQFPGGGERVGLAGLRDYLREGRQNDFLDTLCRKLLSYALGRTLLPSDDPTLQQMRQKLAAGGYRFETLVETIVASRQFRTRRAAVSPGA